MIDRFETGHTVQMTWVSSVPPDAAPSFAVTEPWSQTLIASVTAIESDTTHYTALFTMPTSEGHYIGEWKALKTVSGSAYQFVKRTVFQVQKTAIPD